MIGRTIGRYRVVERLGRGGMGEVFAAVDTSLGRKVALKVLPSELADDPDRLERFRREARAVAALNHPNVVTIHSVEELDGILVLTLELVEGRRLDELVPPDGLPLDRFLDLAIPIADGVAAAHQKGIVHRDLKPGNVMVTSEGRVKILDFGLAKLQQDAAADGEAATEALTGEGHVLGTLPYMAPEQLAGGPVDHRTDVFSLGVLLFEMATGVRPFRGDSAALLASAILRDDAPAVTDLSPAAPRQLARILRHCLEKDPAERFQTALDIRNELKQLRREVEADRAASGATTAVPVLPAPVGPRRRRGWIAAAAAAAALGLLAFLATRWNTVGPETREATAAAVLGAASPTPAPRPKIVVLPFENLGEPGDAYFADGMSEEITSRLASLDGLGVISRSSAVRYKERRPPVPQIGRELGVDYILEGTVRWERPAAGPSRVRVTPQLVRVADDTHVWSSRFDEQLDEVFAVQTAIAEAVARQLDVELLSGERAALAERPTANLEAYQAYLRGNELWTAPGFDRERFGVAAELFERAVALDPAFTLAWSRVAEVHGQLYRMSNERRHLDVAAAAIARARALDPAHPRTHLAAATWEYAQGRWEPALVELERAAATLPNDSELHYMRGLVHRRLGHFAEAERRFRSAAELDPQSAVHLQTLASTLFAQRRFADAAAAIRRAIALAPDEIQLYEIHAQILLATGDVAAARTALAAAPDSDASWLWTYLAALGGDLDAVAEQLAPRYARAEDTYDRARLAVLLGEVEARLGPGRAESARRHLREALAATRELAARDQTDAGVLAYTARAQAGLGMAEQAIASGRRAVELSASDRFAGARRKVDLAAVYMHLGREDEAVELLGELLREPYDEPLTPELLQLDPLWDPLRDHPGFAKLVAAARLPQNADVSR